jgi:hypothetical protein
MKAFISYAHRDSAMLERLHTHLAMLRREGGISDWYDREILAGGSIDREITSQLNDSRLFLALVSPDFLSSKYCYESEMQTAIKKHEAGTMVVVPIVLEPCDWLSSPLKQFKALPRDGKPISEWTNQNAAMLDVVTELRRLVQGIILNSTTEPAPKPSTMPVERAPLQSKYRVKKTFDEIDRDDFRRSAYEEIRDYFEKSAHEIDKVEGLRSRYQLIGPMSFTCSVVNQMIKAGRGTAHITVRMSPHPGLGDISYSFSANAADNTAHGAYSVEADDYHLFLKPQFSMRSGRERTWSAKEAAHQLWQEFLEQAGISYD